MVLDFFEVVFVYFMSGHSILIKLTALEYIYVGLVAQGTISLR